MVTKRIYEKKAFSHENPLDGFVLFFRIQG